MDRNYIVGGARKQQQLTDLMRQQQRPPLPSSGSNYLISIEGGRVGGGYGAGFIFGHYTIPPLPPGAIILSDEIIEQQQPSAQTSNNIMLQAKYKKSEQSLRNADEYGQTLSSSSPAPSSYLRRRPRPRPGRNIYEQKDAVAYVAAMEQREMSAAQANAYTRQYSNFQKNQHTADSFTSSSTMKKSRERSESSKIELQQQRKNVYSTDGDEAVKSKQQQQEKADDGEKKLENYLVQWGESDADQYGQAVATQYASNTLNVPMTVKVHAIKDSGHSFIKRRAVRISDNLMCIPGVERIIEKRFYIRKEKKKEEAAANLSSQKISNQSTYDGGQQTLLNNQSTNVSSDLQVIYSEIRRLRNELAAQQQQLQAVNHAKKSLSEARPFFSTATQAHHNASLLTTIDQQSHEADYENVKDSLLKKQEVQSSQTQEFKTHHHDQLLHSQQAENALRFSSINVMQAPIKAAENDSGTQKALNTSFTTRGPISFNTLGPPPPPPSSNKLEIPVQKQNSSSRNESYELMFREAYGIVEGDEDTNAINDAYTFASMNGFEYLLNSQPDSFEYDDPHFAAATQDANALFYLANCAQTNNMPIDETGNTFNHEIEYPLQQSIVDQVVAATAAGGRQYCAKKTNSATDVTAQATNDQATSDRIEHIKC